jgi:hypothetical protein
MSSRAGEAGRAAIVTVCQFGSANSAAMVKGKPGAMVASIPGLVRRCPAGFAAFPPALIALLHLSEGSRPANHGHLYGPPVWGLLRVSGARAPRAALRQH